MPQRFGRADNIEIEPEFGNFVRSFGGEVVEDLYPPQKRDFRNADYVFRREGVVAELKILTEDQATAPHIRQKTTEIYRRAAEAGLVPVLHGRGNVKLQSRDMPESVRREIAEAHKRPIQTLVHKASKQIKATRNRLDMTAAKGLLILFNDGNFRLEHDAIAYLLARVLGNQFTSINSVFYGTVNLWSESPFTKNLVAPMVSFTREGIKPIDGDFLYALKRGWIDHLDKLRGGPSELIVQTTSVEALSALRLTRSKPGPHSGQWAPKT
jgi:hypothetical protein